MEVRNGRRTNAKINSVQVRVALEGACKKPSTNGWCSEHEKKRCIRCRRKATRNCDVGMGGLVCGAPLCAGCAHHPDGSHTTKSAADAAYKAQLDEMEAKRRSRTDPEPRLDPQTGLPLNLFELRKRDLAEVPIKECFFLELEHGLMGCFPAINASIDQVVLTMDQRLIFDVWLTLPPRQSKVVAVLCYVLNEHGVAYMIPSSEDQWSVENSQPMPLLTREAFDQLTSGDGSEPFRWAPGLIGGRGFSQEQFRALVEETASKRGVSIT